ncbi:DUF7125 family protein [Halosegnis marinus]|uniref:Transcriptional regulator n=1 Tax=Halosegnis marinus TaxID=3034023 RepID=A0ABD5ZLT3_9EURY|nr:hypothetical protein [Halosegnis sp. DT85]
MTRFTTGTGPLDRELDGGFEPGALVAYVAGPAVQAETLLYQLAAQRPTTYVTTVTPERKVREAVDGIAGVGGADGLDTVAVAPDASVASFAERLDVREDSYVLVDAVDLFERSDPADYHAFLGEFADRLDERGAVGVLHAVEGADVSATRDWTLRAADVVVRLAVAFEGIEPETLLRVQRTRGADPPEEALKVKLGAEVEIDTSWDM